MRSCKYLKVPTAEKQRTDILRLRNLKFQKNGAIVPHDSPELKYSENISITFEKQKKDKRDNTAVTQWSTSHALLNPVRSWAAVVNASEATLAQTTTHQSLQSGETIESNISQAKK
jgi:hypothetical protein